MIFMPLLKDVRTHKWALVLDADASQERPVHQKQYQNRQAALRNALHYNRHMIRNQTELLILKLFRSCPHDLYPRPQLQIGVVC